MNEYAKYVRDELALRDKLEQVAEEASELSQAALYSKLFSQLQA